MLKTLLKSKILLSIWLTSIVVLSSLFFLIPNITEENINEIVIENSKNKVNQIKLTRSYYLKSIVNKIEKNNTPLIFTSNHNNFSNGLPLPATLIHDLGEVFSEHTGNTFRTYSNFPFKNREDRILSLKDKITLQNIESSDGIYVSKDFIDNKPVLKVAVADYMNDISCVQCHNSHPDKTWAGDTWKLGDIRGVIEVITPLEDSLNRIEKMRNSILFFIACVFIILIIYYSYTLLKRENELLSINDILDERVKEEISKNNEKEQILIQKSKLASQGEMLSNIAHQWRQPLSELSTILMNIDIRYNSGRLNKQFLENKISKSELLLEYLSGTIDDFRTFLKPDKEKILFNLSELIEHTLNISQNHFSKNITIEKNINDSIDYYGYKSELAQVFLNIISNSKNAFISQEITKPFIKITLYSRGGSTLIQFEDNAGGISEKNIKHIFDLYYTTSDEGSGIGLYMSKLIIEKHFEGKIKCKNTKAGVIFTIKLPPYQNKQINIKDMNEK